MPRLWTTSASADSVLKIMKGACYNVALTCGYAIFANEFINPPYTTQGGPDKNALIMEISEMFYQSLICPENSTFQKDDQEHSGETGYVNSHCKCNTGYDVWQNSCVLQCADGAERSPLSGVCTCTSGSGDGYTSCN